MDIHNQTRSHDLFRIMFDSPDDEGKWTDEQKAAHAEWNRRLEMAEHEYGSSYAKARWYQHYCDGRRHEISVRGEDLRIAKVLLDALTSAGIAPPRDLSASDLIRLRSGR